MAVVYDPWRVSSPENSGSLASYGRDLSEWEGVTTVDLFRQVEDRLRLWEEVGGFDRREPPLSDMQGYLYGLDEIRFNSALSHFMDQNNGMLDIDGFFAQALEWFIDKTGKTPGGVLDGQIIHDGFCVSRGGDGPTFRVFGVTKLDRSGGLKWEWKNGKFNPKAGFMVFEMDLDGGYSLVTDREKVGDVRRAVYENLLNVGRTRRVIIRHYANISQEQEAEMLDRKELLKPEVCGSVRKPKSRRPVAAYGDLPSADINAKWLGESGGNRGPNDDESAMWLRTSNPSWRKPEAPSRSSGRRKDEDDEIGRKAPKRKWLLWGRS